MEKRKERPIIFSAPMIRALLNGNKTQTRRIVKNPDEPGLALAPWNVGDVLWVKEAYSLRLNRNVARKQKRDLYFWADGVPSTKHWSSKKSPLFLPKWASRIHLEIIDVRREHLQQIRTKEILAEGVMAKSSESAAGLRRRFCELWTSIHGPESWLLNPEVWVVEFQVTD